MASFPMKIMVGLTDAEYRPCKVTMYHQGKKQKEYKAFFHKWTIEQQVVAPGVMVGSHPGGQLCSTLALVETEDGRVLKVEPDRIRFLDTEERMSQICFDDRCQAYKPEGSAE